MGPSEAALSPVNEDVVSNVLIEVQSQYKSGLICNEFCVVCEVSVPNLNLLSSIGNTYSDVFENLFESKVLFINVQICSSIC